MQSVTAYEIASVYIPKGLPITELVNEKTQVSGLLYGQRDTGKWPAKVASYDFYDVKGVVEAVLQGLGITGVTLEASDFSPASSWEGRTIRERWRRIG
jgi:phenylalanyl-tRNA synthetase beta chain